MTDNLLGRLSGTGDPHAMNTYTPAASEKNMLTITDYFKLLAAQPANQDMINPTDNSEMMAQMTQTAMIQAVSAMTESVWTSTPVSTQVYVAGLVGQKITATVIEERKYGQDMVVGVQYGKIESVDLMGSTPVLKLMGDGNEYPLSCVLGMGKVDDPYKKGGADDKQTKEEDVESEKMGSSAYDYAAEEDNPLTDKGILA